MMANINIMENFENSINRIYDELRDRLIQGIATCDRRILARIEQSVSPILQEEANMGFKNNIDFGQAQKRYESHLRSSGRAESTVKEYLSEIGKFLEFLNKNNLLLESASLKVVEEYISGIRQERKIKNNSLRKIITLIKVFLKHIKEEYNINIDADRLKMPIKTGVVREAFSPSEIEIMFGYLRNREEKFHFENDRDMVVLTLGAFLGLRISEVRKLNWEDIDFDNNTLFIHNAKGGKDRKLFFGADIKSLLTKYQKETGYYAGAVVRGKCRNRITKCSLTNLINRIYKESGVYRKGLCFHSLRHTYAESLRRNNIDIQTISKALGHADIRTTQMYLHSGDEDLKSLTTVNQLPLTQIQH